MAEFQTLLESQLDLRTEAANLLRFRENFSSVGSVSFPRPVVRLCSRSVLVEDWVEGDSIQNYLYTTDSQLKASLAETGVDMLLKMVFVDNFWHGDLHPGNILVTKEGKLAVVDAGIAGSLSIADRKNIVDTFTAILAGDGTKVGQLFLERSYHQCEDQQAFIEDIRDIVLEARSSQLSLDKVDLPSLLQAVFTSLIKHKVRLDANFSSVIISIAIVEGLGRALDPNLDLVPKTLPYLIKS